MDNKVYFVGAGPGAVDLITLRGRSLLDRADLVVYAGSLVNPALMDGIGAKIVDSSPLNLEEIMELLVDGYRAGALVVRLHTGDPAFYSAIAEQMVILRSKGIPYEVVPGVSSLNAAAAAIPCELTVPGISQTVIITRLAGRTPVPETEEMALLASHGCSMAIFLSVSMIERLRDELSRHYPPETPVVVVSRASWHDELILRGRLSNIVDLVKDADITKTAIVMVGRSLYSPVEGDGAASRLYDRDFDHGYRTRNG